ncbi:MAG: hypothetical protein ACJ741_18990 [Pyrinomonadaceae bacterium]
MAKFTLTKGGKAFDFDTNGEVSRGGTRIGKWSTSDDDDNKLVVVEDGGTQTVFPVTWKFNDKNQLELLDGANRLVNFHGVSGVVPLYKVENAVLLVMPDRSKTFGFNLNGKWGMTPGHDLTIKLGSVTSTIDGHVEDNRSRFIYKFLPKAGDVELYTLTFAGSWSGVSTDGKHIMTFHYTGKKSGDFTLPEGVMFDRSVNQLVYDYDKNGKTRRLQFTGELKLGAKGTITYKLDRQQAGAGKDLVTSTTITIQAAYHTDKGTGDLEFVLLKNDGVTPGTSLVIGGSFEHDIGGTQIKLAFRYTFKKSSGVVKENRLVLGGKFILKNNGTLTWEFSKDSVTKITTITFAAEDFKAGDFVGNIGLRIETENGQVKELHMLLGISF